ncbi:MAG: pyridoxamine 5'-phosphate oxidase family protein [Clostridia bacterium]|nr:pyridoxamine 5'-phosphate oxidase family protein [Clostridia bacterium]
MEEVLAFLDACGTYYLATNDNGQPRVRPFGTALIHEGKLLIQTGKSKPCSKQMHEDPRVEICAFLNGKWLRLTAKAEELDSVAARKAMLDKYPHLRGMYDENDGNCEVFALRDCTAAFTSFTEAPHTVSF